MIVWVLFFFVMWAWAIAGLLTVIFGTISFCVDTDWINVLPGSTQQEKLAYMGQAAFVAAVGLAFVWLRCRGYLKFGDRD